MFSLLGTLIKLNYFIFKISQIIFYMEQQSTAVEDALNRVKNTIERNLAKKASRTRKVPDATQKKQEIEEIMSKPLEHITSVIQKGSLEYLTKDTPEYNAVVEFRATKEFIQATRELDIRKRQEKMLLAQSRPEQISAEQRIAAGYLPAPAGLSLAAAISAKGLRGDLHGVAVPIPINFLKGGLFSENKAVVFGSDGTNLLDDNATRALHLLEHKLGVSIVGNVTPSTQASMPALEHSGSGLGDAQMGGIVPHTSADFILALPLAKEFGLTAADVAITKENEGEIQKFLAHNEMGLQMVTPFSIPAGIVGCTKINGHDALVAFDTPDFRTGQPGQLLMIAANGAFRKAPTSHVAYNPNVEIDLRTGNITNDPLKLAQAQQQSTVSPEYLIGEEEFCAPVAEQPNPAPKGVFLEGALLSRSETSASANINVDVDVDVKPVQALAVELNSCLKFAPQSGLYEFLNDLQNQLKTVTDKLAQLEQQVASIRQRD